MGGGSYHHGTAIYYGMGDMTHIYTDYKFLKKNILFYNPLITNSYTYMELHFEINAQTYIIVITKIY